MSPVHFKACYGFRGNPCFNRTSVLRGLTEFSPSVQGILVTHGFLTSGFATSGFFQTHFLTFFISFQGKKEFLKSDKI